MSNEYKALVGRLEQVLLDLERVVTRTERQMEQALATNDDAYIDAVALNLHGFYAGIEHALEDIAQTMSETLPAGAHWHQNLLLQMSSKIADVRPAVIAIETRYCLDEYRQFRHIVRNVYTFNFRSPSIEGLVTGIRACLHAITHDFEQFSQFLNQLSDE